ncbi:MAG: hypothetical protein ACRCZE_00565 [Candidatus Altimarinota bacterium]
MSHIKTSYSPYRSDFRSESKAAKAGLVQAAEAKAKEFIRFDINPFMLMGILLLLISLLGFFYLLNYNKLATKGYNLKRLEIARQELQTERNEKTLYIAKVRSLTEMLKEEKFDGMVKPAKFEYVTGEHVLAKAD